MTSITSIPFVFVDVDDAGGKEDAGVVDQDVDGAKGIRRPVDHGLNPGGIGDIGLKVKSPGERRTQLFGRTFSVGLVKVVNDEAGTVSRQGPGNRPADALPRTGHDGDAVPEGLLLGHFHLRVLLYLIAGGRVSARTGFRSRIRA